MTNNEIIFRTQLALLADGKIKATGRTLRLKAADGTLQDIPEPEAIHTFAAWKDLGYSVRKGEKAVAKFAIWKYASKVDEETNEEIDRRLFMKNAAFFSASQVEAIS